MMRSRISGGEKPAEELYDLQTDPDEVNNLADAAEHRETLEKMRKAHREWEKTIRDVGFLPEAEVHSRSGGGGGRIYPIRDGA